jgi:NTP pyrophosphatase (non-canonical NTP hydrolase)
MTENDTSTGDMKRTARWHGIAEANIEKWGLQDEETLLLAMQEELGELTQAHLEAKHEDGHELRIDEELNDLGALLIQLVKARSARNVQPDTDR